MCIHLHMWVCTYMWGRNISVAIQFVYCDINFIICLKNDMCVWRFDIWYIWERVFPLGNKPKCIYNCIYIIRVNAISLHSKWNNEYIDGVSHKPIHHGFPITENTTYERIHFTVWKYASKFLLNKSHSMLK